MKAYRIRVSSGRCAAASNSSSHSRGMPACFSSLAMRVSPSRPPPHDSMAAVRAARGDGRIGRSSNAHAAAQIEGDETLRRLREFRAERIFVGPHNREDVNRGFARLDFAPEAMPRDEEGIAENGQQLFALCRQHGVNHLIYAGFAINWC